MLIEKNSKLVMIGDSITDCGRRVASTESTDKGLGRGYVSLVDALIGSGYPDYNIWITNRGIDGNTVRDLKSRWQSDVIDLKPDWLSILIGINDVWRQFDMPEQPNRHVLIDEYERTLDELVGQTKSLVKGIILLTPFYLEPNLKDPMRAQMDRHGAKVRELATRHQTVFVDTQAAFDQALAAYYPATLAWDRVHPNQVGHMIIARALLNAIRFAW